MRVLMHVMVSVLICIRVVGRLEVLVLQTHHYQQYASR